MHKGPTHRFVTALAAASLAFGFAPAALAETGQWTFTPANQILNAGSINQPVSDNTGTADVSAMRLPDGRIRVYFGVINANEPGRIGSAISTDGKSFVVEPGDRIGLIPTAGGMSMGAASPFVYRLPDGRYRLYYSFVGGIASSTSTDGLTFTQDPGMRLLGTSFIAQPTTRVQVHCSAIVPLADGRYRMYCAQGVASRQAFAVTLVDRAIFSAVSTNLLDWTPEPGVRIGPGSAIVTDADHPTVLASSPSGAVTLVYDRRRGGQEEWSQWGEFMASSADGLTFTAEKFTGIQGTEPSYVPLTNATGWLYYGNHTPQTGSIISVASATSGTQQMTAKITCVKNGKRKTFVSTSCPRGWKLVRR